MIHLNHAGTSWPKPPLVRHALQRAYQASSSTWARSFSEEHATIAGELGFPPDRFLLTPGCTSALALAVRSFGLRTGDSVFTSAFEHHAVTAALAQVPNLNVHVIAPIDKSPMDLRRLESMLAEKQPALMVCTHASNVTGAILPIEEIAKLCHAAGVPLFVDAAQTAGWLDLSPLPGLSVSGVAFAGHKALQGPWGIGGLYLHTDHELPSYCDAGSVDRAAMAGLIAGLAFVQKRPERLAKARAQIEQIERVIGSNYLGPKIEHRLPTVAFVPDGGATRFASRLHHEGIVASGGHQCAFAAYKTLGHAEALRLSVGPQTTQDEVATLVRVLQAMLWSA